MTTARRSRRWLVTLSVLLVALVLGAWWINRQLQPDRLTATVLRKAGTSLGLELRFKGQPEYALKPEPRLLIPNFSVSGPDGKVFLFAKRAEISLPWSTITGNEPVITRIELEQPVLDLPGLRRWMASRPKIPFELPTLSKGLRVINGSITDRGYAISQLALELPRLKTGERAQLAAEGKFAQGQTLATFKLDLDAATAGLQSDFTVQGNGELQQSPEPLKFQLQASGHYASTDTAFTVDAPVLKLRGTSPLPDIAGKGQLKLAEKMQWTFDGTLLDWPKAWPALPQPLVANTANLPVALSYLGKPDLSDPLALVVAREPTMLQASLRIAQLRQWLALPGGSPLPPINATLRTPSLVFGGVQLQGVEVEISDDKAPGSAP